MKNYVFSVFFTNNFFLITTKPTIEVMIKEIVALLDLYFFDYVIRKDNTMTVNIYYTESDVLKIASYPYTYTKDVNGIYSFSPLPLDLTTADGQRADLIKGYLTNLFSITNSNTFSIEFFDAFDELGGLIAQFTSQENSEIYFTGFFY